MNKTTLQNVPANTGPLFLASTFTLVLILILNNLTFSQNWPQWRGPSDNLVAEPGDYPIEFSANDNVLWKVQLPGKGGSTPIVWNDRIFVTCGIGDGENAQDGVLCYNWSGAELWRVALGKQDPGKHPRGSGSNPSIVTNGDRLFAYYKSGTLAALDYDGTVIWQTNLQERFGSFSMFFDLGTSPVLADENVVVAVMHADSSYLVAFNQESGAISWKYDRNYVCEEENDQAYTTPLVVTEGDRTVLIVWGADHLTGHDAGTGQMLWSCGGFNPQNKKYWRVIASPAFSNEIAVVPYGREKHVAGIKIGGSGDITESARIWEKSDMGTDVATPVIKDGKVYIVSFKGNVWCLDVGTGVELWQSKLPRGKGTIFSSPTLSQDKLYICREEGAVYVAQITATGLQVLTETHFDEKFVATPVLVQDKILLRGEKYLYCIGK